MSFFILSLQFFYNLLALTVIVLLAENILIKKMSTVEPVKLADSVTTQQLLAEHV